jgi:hypothetical protein
VWGVAHGCERECNPGDRGLKLRPSPPMSARCGMSLRSATTHTLRTRGKVRGSRSVRVCRNRFSAWSGVFGRLRFAITEPPPPASRSSPSARPDRTCDRFHEVAGGRQGAATVVGLCDRVPPGPPAPPRRELHRATPAVHSPIRPPGSGPRYWAKATARGRRSR